MLIILKKQKPCILSSSYLLSTVKISSKTLERVQIAKTYIEKKYALKKKKEEETNKEWTMFMEKLNELNISSKEKELIKKEVQQKEAEILRYGYFLCF